MKKTLLFWLVLHLLAASGVAGPVKQQLVGHWRYNGEQQTCDYAFKSDGTFTGNLSEDGKIVLEYSGKWSLDGDKLKYEFTKCSPEVIPVGTTDQDRIIELTADYYIVETHYYAQRQYSRVD